jgi:membrane-bound serine protease (ClpP class)
MRLIASFVVCILAFASISVRADGSVVALDIKGAIGVAKAEYVLSGIEHAESINAELIIIAIDTPGGLMAPMRDIVQAILGSDVPVAVYVTPAGARADSAGTYILLASHIAAMTPTTHLGAATPVPLVGGEGVPEDIADDDSGDDTRQAPASGGAMERKVMNDAVAYIRSLAERHGRNAEWAEKAVRDAATLTAREALEQNVVDYLAEDRGELLRQLDGAEIKVNSETLTLSTSDVVIEDYVPNWRIKILSAIANPETVLLLGIIGLYGLMYEGWNPGAIVPGVVGVICLLLAAYALQVLPVNYAGLALIVVGLALMTAEAFAPSFGALGLGGIAAFVFGAIMMFDSGIPGFGISITFVVIVAAVFALLFIWLVSYLLRLRKRGAVSGKESIIGGTATAMQDFTDEGMVWLEGESWTAHSAVAIEKDQQVIVVAMDGLTLTVTPLAATGTDEARQGT